MGIRIKDLQSGSPLPNDFMAFDGDGGTRKATVGAVIGAVSSNRNLLDNPWFKVNQRGVSGVVSAGGSGSYGLDRWLSYASTSSSGYSVSGDTVTLAQNTGLTQRFNASDLPIVGKTVTLSILLTNGTIIVQTMTIAANTQNYIDANGFRWMIDTRSTLSNYAATIIRRDASSVTLKAVKLELGSVSTLANDVAPNYAEELLKCQRYFWRLGGVSAPLAMMAAYDSNIQYGYVQFPVTMRATPTVSMSALSTFQVFANNANPSPTSMRVVPVRPQNGMIETKASGITAGSAGWLLTTASGGYINFSADL